MAFVQWYCVLIFSSSADYLSLFICLIFPLSTGIILSFVRAPFSLLKVSFHWSADRLHFISLLDFPFNTQHRHRQQVPPQSGRNGGRIFLRDYVQVNRAEGCYSGNALATMPRLKIIEFALYAFLLFHTGFSISWQGIATRIFIK